MDRSKVMNIYKIAIDEKIAGFKLVNESDISMFDDYNFEDKIELTSIWSPLNVEVFKKKGRRKVDSIGDFHMMLPVFVISEKAKSFFETELQHGTYEILPLNPRNVEDNFYAFNVIDRVNAIDLEKSKVIYYLGSTDRIMDFEELVLFPSAVAGLKVFKATGFNVTYCSEEMKTKIENAGIEGITFDTNLW